MNLAAAPFSRERDVHPRLRASCHTQTHTHTPARTHRIHFGFYVSRALCKVCKRICRCGCADTHLMHVSRHVCVRACVRMHARVMNVCVFMALGVFVRLAETGGIKRSARDAWAGGCVCSACAIGRSRWRQVSPGRAAHSRRRGLREKGTRP